MVSDRLKKAFLITGIPVALLFGFNNCSKVAFDDAQVFSSLGDPEVTSDDPQIPPDDVKEVFINCQNGILKEKSAVLDFPKEQVTCDWDTGGNLNQRNSYVQARREQSVNITLPQGAIICDVEFASQNVNMLYDDQILMTLNDSVLMSSSKKDIVGSFAKRAGIPQYNWSEIMGMGMDVQIYDPFCLGAQEGFSSCQFPASEKSGNMELIFGSSVIQTIMAMDINKTTHTFKFITTGDNDSSDCKHNDFSIPLKIKYVIK